MAETAVAALFKVIFQKLADEASNRYDLSQRIQSDLKNLGKKLSQIQPLLNDASHKEVKEEAVKRWLNDLQHLAYDIEDILDDVVTDAMRLELTQESGSVISKIRNFILTCCTNFSLSRRLHKKLEGITTELDRLYKEKSDLGLIVKDANPKYTSRRNETSLLEIDIVGREGEKRRLINQLLMSESSNENFSILPIVGLGGVGKTTLARILYNDARVKNHFQLMAWVCISDDFDIFKISETIFQSVATEKKQFPDINQLQVALGEQVKNKRFLIVLDDVWTENYDNWEKLMRPFHLGAQGSRVIMTTRKHQLLEKIGFKHLDHLESLSHEDALSLLALHTLGLDNFDSHAKLKPQAEGIVKKCGGLPLALKAIGRLLRTKTEGEEWDDVLNSEIWNLENADEIVPALRLSYNDLSADLKRLFAYCSLFPKDFLFDKDELVLLWVAEGYLNESLSNKSPERLGHEYFEKLLSRSFFQPAPNGESFFVMHDLMSDLATFVAGEYSLRFDKEMEMTEEALAKYRHMSFIREEHVAFHKFKAFERARSLRTLLAVYVVEEQSWNKFYLSNKILPHLLPRLPLLRVLSLRQFNIREVPDVICSLYHLRYLNLSETNISHLPENVCNLYNLQTLIVFDCGNLTTLPKSFSKLKKLRHFDIRNTPLLKKLPLGIGELKSLQTLTGVIIGGNSGFAITELKGLNDLHGEISIKGLGKVNSSIHAREANLSLKRLTKLKMEWSGGSRSGTLEKEVLNELKPHSDTLKTLVVNSYNGIEFPNWVGDPSFRRLVHVWLHGCLKCESLPSLGRLPSLKDLWIQGMVKVQRLELTRTNDVTFPSLEILRFEDMWSWKVWSTNSEVMFPCLRELEIKRCYNLTDVSLESLPSLKVLVLDGCGESVLRSLVRAASSTIELEIRSILGLTDEVWRGVIVNMGAVEELRIDSCDEIRYLWESNVEASKVLVNLKDLRVYRCEKFVSLGEKEEDEDNTRSNLLSSLRKLYIGWCKSMERLCCPNSIESLYIQSCDSVRQVSFPGATTTGEGGQSLKSLTIEDADMEKINNTSMPMLQDITIRGWKNLKTINQLSNSTHLTSLSIKKCESMESFSKLQLSNLTRLDIYDCESIESIPNLHLPNLTHLDISHCKNMKEIRDLQIPNLISWRLVDCENLESFPYLELSSLNMLKDLEILSCPMIEASFPGGIWPPSLVYLEIGRLKKPITEWGNQNFPASLVKLVLRGESHVRNFSQLSHLFPSSLTSLEISGFENLESVSTGLQHLTSLQHLTISYCPNMKHLPGMLLLDSLLSLEIDVCPKLRKRCKGRGSHYWPQISHIPKIEIY